MIDATQRLQEIHAKAKSLLARRLEEGQFYLHLTTSNLRMLFVVFCAITVGLFFILVMELRARIRYQQELQAKVIDLERSHNELREIAFAASHDLQEPLRKIQVFSDRLLHIKTGKPDGDTEAMLRRINSSANRLRELINALRNLTELVVSGEQKKTVDLANMMHYVLQDLDDRINAEHADLHVNALPVVQGYPQQLKILFTALLDNALKFRKEGVEPVISVTGDEVNGYELIDINPDLANKKFHRIVCADNGIGFDNQYINKIFRIFQRLHPASSSYEGKGIGLAICRRIMDNHNGYIIANGRPGEGAEFRLFFPVS
jgi:light-regulated signal transduction histidine kinase (bacteriophytochrome)